MNLKKKQQQNHCDQKQVGGEKINFILQPITQGNPRQKFKSGTNAEAMEGAAYVFAPITCSTTKPDVAPTTVIWALPYHSSIKKMYCRLAHRPYVQGFN